jgi:tRNA threonylcarbamoyladenosine biosynthesis protein TsaB
MLDYNKYKINDFEDVAYFEPYYLKDFVALKSNKN